MIDDDFEKNLTKNLEQFLNKIEDEFYQNINTPIPEDELEYLYSTLEELKEVSEEVKGALGIYIRCLISDISRILDTNKAHLNNIKSSKNIRLL